ncbi:hypothetical protein AVEN_96843-1 [Araneus ventricosus]|uniref:Uncharacterized protein n=1 Tax=Araneus ventricosus TaxID=182803 RepID=A0A4Y2VME1_ARAVE|nr:hypothetical protein AVEN_157326-1 [Araneus ventricosus]GBO26503.1 hypothetical protein AVEN_96843-1 [Araneus ventricosus]
MSTVLCNHMSQSMYKISGDMNHCLYWNSSHSSQTGCTMSAIVVGFSRYIASFKWPHKKKSHGSRSGGLTGPSACLIYSNMMLQRHLLMKYFLYYQKK